jgi:hypothetical protein
MRVGSRPSSAKPGIVPGLLPGIGLVLAAVLAVGIGSVASTALAGGKSHASSGASQSSTPSSSLLAVASPGAAASQSPLVSASPSPTHAVPIATGPVHIVKITYRFNATDLGWKATSTQAGGASFSPRFDGTFSHDSTGGSLAATTTAGGTATAAGGQWILTSDWASLGVRGSSIVSVAASFDVYVDALNGVASVGTSMDFAGADGMPIARIVPAATTGALTTWTTVSGTAYAVPPANGSASSTVSFVLNAGTEGAGGATWHIDDVTLTITYR